MHNFFRTFTVLIIGIVFVLVYVVTFYRKGKFSEINLFDTAAVFFSATGFLLGVKIVYENVMWAYGDEGKVDTEKLYAIAGGASLIWNVIRTLYKKLK